MAIPYGFTEADAKKIARAASIVLRSPRFGPAPRTRFPVGEEGDVKHAIVTSTILAATAGTPNKPGKGVVDLYFFNADPAVENYAAYASGVIVWNDAAGAGASLVVGTQIKVIVQDGQWFVIWNLC